MEHGLEKFALKAGDVPKTKGQASSKNRSLVRHLGSFFH